VVEAMTLPQTEEETLLGQLKASGLCYYEQAFEDKSEYVLDIFKRWLEKKRQKVVNRPTQRTYTKECYLHVYNELLRELK
jgi:hypothetical protein